MFYFLLFKQNSIKKSFRSEADLFYAKVFPIFVSVILTLFHVSYPYFSAQTENVNLANLLNLFCFNLYLFGLLFFLLLLDKSSWMRVGELSGGLDIEDIDPPTHKKRSVKFCDSQSCNQNHIWHYFKQTRKSNVFKKVA